MIQEIRAIYSLTERKGIVSLFLSSILGIMVFLENSKRYVYRNLEVIGNFQSLIIYFIIYLFIAPVTFLLFLLSGKWTSQKKDDVYTKEHFNSHLANHRKMY